MAAAGRAAIKEGALGPGTRCLSAPWASKWHLMLHGAFLGSDTCRGSPVHSVPRLAGDGPTGTCGVRTWPCPSSVGSPLCFRDISRHSRNEFSADQVPYRSSLTYLFQGLWISS